MTFNDFRMQELTARRQEGGNEMDLYFMEVLMRERQREIAEEFRQIHMSKGAGRRRPGRLKKRISGFFEKLFSAPKRQCNYGRQQRLHQCLK